MSPHRETPIRKFICVNHFSPQVYLASSVVRQDDIAIAVEHLVVVVSDFARVLVILVLFYRLELLQELVLLVSRHPPAFFRLSSFSGFCDS